MEKCFWKPIIYVLLVICNWQLMIANSFYCFPSFLYYVYSNPVLHTNDKSQRNRSSIHYIRLSFPFLFSIDPNKYFSFALLLADPNYHFMHFHISECLYNIILPFCSQIIHHSLPGKGHTSFSFCKKTCQPNFM